MSITRLFFFTLIILISSCGGGKESNSVTVNIPPTSNAGPDQTVDEQSTVTFQGSGADSDGIVTFAWIQSAGTGVNIINNTDVAASFIAPTTSSELLLTFELTATDNDGAVSKDTVDIIINPIALGLADLPKTVQQLSFIKLDGIDINEPLRLVSIFSGINDLNTSSETSLERIDIDELVYVVNHNDQIVMIGQFLQGSTKLTLSSKTTAIALLTMYPSIASNYSIDPQNFVSLITNYNEVKTLANMIDENPDWSLATNSDFISAYVDAIERIETVIQNGTISTSAKHLAIKNIRKKKIIEIDTSQSTKSGLSIRVVGEQDISEEPEFKLSVYNEFNRYVVIAVGDKGKSFLVLPDEYATADATNYYKSQIALAEDVEEKIYGYGIGNGTLSKKVTDEYDLYAEATIATLINYYVIPEIKSRLALNEKCLRDQWLPVSPDTGLPSLVRSSIINLNLYRNNLADHDLTVYQTTGMMLFALMREGNKEKEDIDYCIAKRVLEGQANSELTSRMTQDLKNIGESILLTLGALPLGHTSSFFSAVNNHRTTKKGGELFGVPPKLAAVIASSQKSVDWLITNEQVKTVKNFKILPFTPDDTINETILGLPQYRDQYAFTENCPVDGICKHYVYKRLRPQHALHSINFDVSCNDINDTAQKCRNMVIDFGDKGPIEGGTKSEPTIPLNGGSHTKLYKPKTAEKQTYSGGLAVADYDGAYVNYDFVLQIEEAVPELVILIDGKEYPKGVNDTLSCAQGEGLKSINITLFNKGLGSYYLNMERDNLLDVDGDWSLDTPFLTSEIPWGKSQSRVLTYDCNNADPSHYWSYTFKDGDNDTYNLMVYIYYSADNAPTINGTVLQQPITTSGDAISINAKDDIEIQSIQLYIGNKAIGSPVVPQVKTDDFSYVFSINVENYTVGEHQVKVTVLDSSGASEHWEGVIEIDKCAAATAPIIENVVHSCISHNTRAVDISFQDPLGVMGTGMWFKTTEDGEYQYGYNSFSSGIIEGDQFKGVFRTTIPGPPSYGHDCEKDDFYTEEKIWHSGFKIVLKNSCGMETESTFNYVYWDHLWN